MWRPLAQFAPAANTALARQHAAWRQCKVVTAAAVADCALMAMRVAAARATAVAEAAEELGAGSVTAELLMQRWGWCGSTR